MTSKFCFIHPTHLATFPTMLLANTDKIPRNAILSQSSFLQVNFSGLLLSAKLPLYVEITSGIFSPLFWVDLWKETNHLLEYASC